MQVKVHLHGAYKDFHDGPVTVNAYTVADAIAAVTRMLPGFRPNAATGRHRVVIVGYDTPEKIHSVPTSEDIHLIPQLTGGKKGGFLQIIVGAVLAVVGFALGQPWLIKLGVLIALGGLASMLAPTPEADTGNQSTKSRYLGAPKNTVEIGTRIPILYGRHRVYGHYLSMDIDATVDIEKEDD